MGHEGMEPGCMAGLQQMVQLMDHHRFYAVLRLCYQIQGKAEVPCLHIAASPPAFHNLHRHRSGCDLHPRCPQTDIGDQYFLQFFLHELSVEERPIFRTAGHIHFQPPVPQGNTAGGGLEEMERIPVPQKIVHFSGKIFIMNGIRHAGKVPPYPCILGINEPDYFFHRHGLGCCYLHRFIPGQPNIHAPKAGLRNNAYRIRIGFIQWLFLIQWIFLSSMEQEYQ